MINKSSGKGKYSKENAIASTTVNAGQQGQVGGDIDTSKAEFLVVGIDGGATHTWSAQISWLKADGTNYFVDNAPDIIASGSRRRGNSGRVTVLAPLAKIYVTNSDGSNHNYIGVAVTQGVAG